MKVRWVSMRRVYGSLGAMFVFASALAAVLWVRGAGFHRLDGAEVSGRGLGVVAVSVGGTVSFACSIGRTRSIDDPWEPFGVNVGTQRVDPAWWAARVERYRPQVEWWGCGALGARVSVGHPDKYYAHNRRWVPLQVDLPHWLVLVVSLLIATGTRRGYRRALCRERMAAGLCGACGYDVRATPGRCPECGQEAAPVRQSRELVGDWAAELTPVI